jgi:hypothetical protein
MDIVCSNTRPDPIFVASNLKVSAYNVLWNRSLNILLIWMLFVPAALNLPSQNGISVEIPSE